MNNECILKYIRWTARIFLVVLLFQLIVYVYYIATESSNFSFNSINALTLYKSNGFLTVVLAGMIIAWKQEALGGILITAGLISFHLLNCMEGGYFSFFAFTFCPGILLMLYGIIAKRDSRNQYLKGNEKCKKV